MADQPQELTPEQVAAQKASVAKQAKLMMAGTLVTMARATDDPEIKKWADTAVNDITRLGFVADLLATSAAMQQAAVNGQGEPSRREQSNALREKMQQIHADRVDAANKQKQLSASIMTTILNLIMEQVKSGTISTPATATASADAAASSTGLQLQ